MNTWQSQAPLADQLLHVSVLHVVGFVGVKEGCDVTRAGSEFTLIGGFPTGSRDNTS